MSASNRQLSSGSQKKHRATQLNLEQLEARMLMSINSIDHALQVIDAEVPDLAAAVKAAPAKKNAAPTVAKAITVSGGNTINGATANLTVLGKDDQAESQLTYAWRATAVSGGGSASFSASGNNAAKSTRATFTKAGSYDLRVTITDKSGASVSATQRVTVRLADAFTLSSSAGAVSDNGSLSTTASQLTVTSSAAATWQSLSAPDGANSTISTTGNSTTLAFDKAGTYRFSATSGSRSVAFNVVVNQAVASISVTADSNTVSPNATRQFTATATDQFGGSMSFSPTWTTSAGTITSGGLLTAPGSGNSVTVTARSGNVTGTATVSISAQSSIQDSTLASLVTTLYADGSLNRADVMQLLRSTGTDGTVSGTELSDLRWLVSNAVTYAMPGYVQVLASNVVNANVANALYQGSAAGNLAAGSTNALLTKLVDKWFMGTDLPTVTGSGISYRAATGPLFVNGTALLTDQHQGALGDCYFISTIGALANRNPTAVSNMFIDNGDGTFTVRFYSGSYGMSTNANGSISDGFNGGTGTADYVTVNRQLPSYSNSTFAYSNAGMSVSSASAPLWIALAEKAYAQWNETGKSGRTRANTYAAIEGGWMGTVNAQVLGVNATSYVLANTNAQPLIDALAAGKAVTIGTKTGAANGLVGSHAYSVTAYNSSTQTFTLYNPWGSNQPGQLTWAQLQSNCTWFTFANATSSPIASSASGTPTVRSFMPVEQFASFNIMAEKLIDELEESGDQPTVQATSSVGDGQVFAADHVELSDSWFADVAADNAEDQASDRQLTLEAVDYIFDHLDSLLS